MSNLPQVRMLETASTHTAGEVGELTTRETSTGLHWIRFTPDRGAWCTTSEYELVDHNTQTTPALAEGEPHQVIAAATDAFNETLARVAEEVATRCNLSISVISELLVTGWSFTVTPDGEPNRWTAPAPTTGPTTP